MEYISDCDECDEEMEAERKFDLEITCSNCGTVWILEWDRTDDYEYFVAKKEQQSPRPA